MPHTTAARARMPATARRCGGAGCHSFVLPHKDLQMFLFYPGAPGRALPHLYEKACKSTPRRGTLAGLRAPIYSRRLSGPPPPAFPSGPPRTPTNQLCAKGGPRRPPPLPPRPPAAAARAPRQGSGCAAFETRWGRQCLSPAAPAGTWCRAPCASGVGPRPTPQGPHLKAHTPRESRHAGCRLSRLAHLPAPTRRPPLTPKSRVAVLQPAPPPEFFLNWCGMSGFSTMACGTPAGSRRSSRPQQLGYKCSCRSRWPRTTPEQGATRTGWEKRKVVSDWRFATVTVRTALQRHYTATELHEAGLNCTKFG